mmetsp:Transcript_5844/g.11545  ORF Transcript_5844/g.11545 Transcript_5844/m.11545 type:complete len:92 (+) Transcript_5844:209-484(+)|eukprot:CAMPEP_0184690196 /NCGR_PEP_ID=MMETSP0312-20130426/31086_1 /TAXON_ID=31354 /ORGANISM="Compsopogon coeruleus, Strain SAG 36.94" /LENGTH=91 /DNA_ID=CAMNT_0027147651 /DNA_START=2355 /DNA_END=2630 /DNA_ORIENTATION=+
MPACSGDKGTMDAQETNGRKNDHVVLYDSLRITSRVGARRLVEQSDPPSEEGATVGMDELLGLMMTRTITKGSPESSVERRGQRSKKQFFP